jgi:beta-lactamase superfamily II metal-dependent hydrolase
LVDVGIEKLDAVVVTHFDVDHFGGIPALVRFYNPGVVFANPDTPMRDDSSAPKYRAALAALADLDDRGLVENRPAWGGERHELGDIRWRFLAPRWKNVMRAVGKRSPDRNVASAVVRIEVGAFVVLVGGDAVGKVWAELLDAREDLRADVFRSPHHGGPFDGDLTELLDTISPSHVAISVGSRNNFNHPNPQFVETVKNDSNNPRIMCTNATPLCAGGVVRQDGSRGSARLPCADTVRIEARGDRWRVLPSVVEHGVRISDLPSPQCLQGDRSNDLTQVPPQPTEINAAVMIGDVREESV